MSQRLGPDGGEQAHQDHVGVELVMDGELLDRGRLVDGLVVDRDVDAGADQGYHVGAVKGIETPGADLDRPVAPHELMPEVDPDLGNRVISGQDQSAN